METEEITIVVKKKKPEGFIELFIDQIINGGGGFKVMEHREFAVYADREVGIAEFVIKCLANPECEGSQEVFEAIERRRNALKTKTSKP